MPHTNKMKSDQTGVTLNGHVYSIHETITLANEKVKEDIPPWEKNIYAFLLEFLGDGAFIRQESSGTTGESKVFHLAKGCMITSAQKTAEYFGLKRGDTALLCLPVEYIAGKMMVVRALVSGLNLVWQEPGIAPELKSYREIDFCAMVPLQVRHVMQTDDFSVIKQLIIGGSRLDDKLRDELKAISTMCYETYGMTETCSHVALRKLNGENADRYFEALPGVTFHTDKRGCLIIHAHRLQESIVTNDIVELIDSEHFELKGRFDDLINTGGIKVNPAEVEEKISGMIPYEFAIIGLPDSILGQSVTLVLETEEKMDKKTLHEKLSNALSKYEKPRQIFTVKSLPRNASLKIDRRRLQDDFR